MLLPGKPMAIFASFLFLALSFSSTVISQESSFQNPGIQSMMFQACKNVNNQATCLLNLHLRTKHTGEANNPDSILKAALGNTLKEARQAIDSITKFTTFSVSSREQIAIEDCKELLDFSVSELAWSLSEMNKIRSGFKNIHSHGNLKAWLSAALSNQDTCLEGFEGTDRHLERFIRGSLTQVTQLISNVLKLYVQLHGLPFKPRRNNTSVVHYHHGNNNMDYFPKWMTEGDKQLLVSGPNKMHVDAVVSPDGSGDYRSITQAIYEAPSHSKRRYIIYVKKGVYHENIDMKKKKTNIMLIGDGMGATVVTGSRNFMQGWTTFRTPTVGKSIVKLQFHIFYIIAKSCND